MDASEREDPEAWAALEARPRVLLACHCPKQSGDDAIPLRCHRVLVARSTWARSSALRCGRGELGYERDPHSR